MTLIPADELTGRVIVALGVGRDPTSGVNPLENGSPVWVTPAGADDVEVCVDLNGDGVGVLVDGDGGHFDLLLTLDELEATKVFDPDGDQSAMVLYTCDESGASIVAAWGQDPAAASAGAPALDLGTMILPVQSTVVQVPMMGTAALILLTCGVLILRSVIRKEPIGRTRR